MLTITDSALARLTQRLDRRGAAAEQALRFTRREGGWKLSLSHASDGDTLFQHEGRTVLLLDKAVSDALSALTLDVSRVKTSGKLRLRRTTEEPE